MPQINRPPRGLNDLLQLQTKGNNPNQLLETIQPTIDFLPFIMSQKNLESAFASELMTVAATPNFFAEIEVPAGELWIVRALSGQSNQHAGAVMQMSIGMEDVNQANADILFRDWVFRTTVAGLGSYLAAVIFPEPIWAPGGAKLGTWIQLSDADVNITTRVLFTRLTV